MQRIHIRKSQIVQCFGKDCGCEDLPFRFVSLYQYMSGQASLQIAFSKLFCLCLVQGEMPMRMGKELGLEF